MQKKRTHNWKAIPVSLIIFCLIITAIFLLTKTASFFTKPVEANSTSPSWAPQQTPPLMAGDTLWNGVPSMLWGTNDTQIWDAQHSIITEPVIQQETKADKLALIRTWLFQTDLATNQPETDTYQQSKINASLATGAKILCELPTANSMSYDEHMVSLFKGQCSYYEFMNEPDDEGISEATYISDWTTEIPKLRSIDPQAKFGGPASAAPQYNNCTYTATDTVCYMQKVLQGMAQNNVLPDFVTFHWYPCWNDTAASCMQKANSFGEQVTMVKGWLSQYFGTTGATIPVGISEWNADPSAPMPTFTNDACWLEQFTTTAEESMAQAGASFANQFDLADAGGYNTDDMVDIYNNGAAKPQYYALVNVINQIYPQGNLPMPTLSFTQPANCAQTKTPTPTTISTTPTPTNTPTPSTSITPTPSPITGAGTLTFLGSVTANGNFGGAGIKLTLPQTVKTGELLIAAVGTNGNPATWTTPTGWTKGKNSGNTDSQGLQWFWKIATPTDAGKAVTLKSSVYADGGAVIAVYNGETASPIAGVSQLTTSDNGGNGVVTTAQVNPVSLPSQLTTEPLIITSWQQNDTNIRWPNNYTFEATATDGYGFIALGENLSTQTTNTLPAQILNFSQPQSVVQSLQIAVRVK